jgi:hypothetical protein
MKTGEHGEAAATVAAHLDVKSVSGRFFAGSTQKKFSGGDDEYGAHQSLQHFR